MLAEVVKTSLSSKPYPNQSTYLLGLKKSILVCHQFALHIIAEIGN